MGLWSKRASLWDVPSKFYAKIEDMKDNGDVEFTDLFDVKQPRSSKELVEERLAICNECPWLNKRLMKCRQCGCFMKLKSTLQQASCPLDKW